MNNIRLLIADDHQMFRMGIKTLLSKEPGIEVVGEARTGEQAVELAARLRPDVILMDIYLPGIDGVEATMAILSQRKDAKVLALTSSEDEGVVMSMIKAGVKGYVLKEAPVDELVLAVKALSNGSSYFAKEVSAKLLALLRQSDMPLFSKSRVNEESLTDREVEVLRHIADEMTNKEIAAKLFISPRTVETHRRNLINKLKVKNTAGLVKYYFNFMRGHKNGTWAN